MTRLAVALEAALEAETLAADLARAIESTLGDPEAIAGALVLSTDAAGSLGEEVGHRLAARWSGAALAGTSFEGIALDGRVWEGEPAVAVLAFSEGEGAPAVVAVEGDAPLEERVREIRGVIGRAGGEAGGLLLLFPDALGSTDLSGLLAALEPTSGEDRWLAGAAAGGGDGGAARAWALPDDLGGRTGTSALLIGLWVPSAGPATPTPRVRWVGATRLASPWLEITACRPHWIDALEGEPPIDWIRRQLGLAESDPIEPYLDRLLVRVARGAACGAVERPEEPADFEERYVSGLDPRRGSIGVMGSFARFDRLAFALPDPTSTRAALREAVDALPPTTLLLQLSCPGRGAALHGDRDLESALVAHQAAGRRVLGVLAPYQIASEPAGNARPRVHATVLAAAGPVLGVASPPGAGTD